MPTTDTEMIPRDQTPWVETSRRELVRNYGRGVDRVTFRMPTGVDAEFDIATQPPSAGIVAITPEHRVILVPQFRPGPKTTLFELPGGFLDDDEDPYAAAQRELEEETGYRGDLQYAGRCYREAYSNAVKHCFVAFDAVPVAQRRVEDNEESVQAVLVDLPVFRDLLRRGKLTDVDLGYLALDAAGLLR